MAHGKETPRQKMIGMMYLVLTALLALNVSKEAVEAFKRVDEGLVKTTDNFIQKNNIVYADFEEKALANPAKAGPWVKVARSVRDRSNELYEYIQSLKVEIVMRKDAEAVVDGHIETDKIKNIDDNNIPSEILIGSNNNGKAFDLKAAIIDYREFLLEQIGEGHPNVNTSIQNSLQTDDVKEHDEMVLWEYYNFHTMPLIAVVTILSKMQNDVRNAEADALGFFFSQIGALDIRVNKLVPTVIGSNHITSGSDYEAKVFIAAMDSTQKPVIQVGKYETITAANGTVEYRMIGDSETLTIDDRGMGVYKKKTSAVGERKWGGLIKINAPDGSTITYPFEGNYIVAAPNVVVSPTAMNVFYTGVENPVNISVPGFGDSQIRATMTNGSIVRGKTKKFRGNWIVKPRRPGVEARVTVIANVGGQSKSMGSVPFRVKPVPDPVAKVARSKGGDIPKATLTAQRGVIAELESFDFDLSFRITGFMISITDSKGFTFDEVSGNNLFTPQQKKLLNRLRRNQTVYISEIKAVGPDGRTRKLAPIVFKIK